MKKVGPLISCCSVFFLLCIAGSFANAEACKDEWQTHRCVKKAGNGKCTDETTNVLVNCQLTCGACTPESTETTSTTQEYTPDYKKSTTTPYPYQKRSTTTPYPYQKRSTTAPYPYYDTTTYYYPKSTTAEDGYEDTTEPSPPTTTSYETEAYSPVTGSTFDPFEEYVCPNSFTLGMYGMCFKYHPVRMPWVEAYKTCVSQNSDLASIVNYQDNELITKLAGFETRVWVGLKNINKDRDFTTWTDGYYVGYTAWAYGYPTDVYGIEHCVTSQYKMWENHPCDDKHFFVCGTKGVHIYDKYA